eukprot:TRINITY_DN5507_c0_g1_i1.p1 TRINITY_DN5507_c0_g1~~TRINITY_DN5507_c0_g1_i1.p1  ORF type:complete len:201 (-),score=46.23 TRINITY_DN5507_c0_g1_i1:25-627(-)
MGSGGSALLAGEADSAMLAAALEKRGQHAVSQEASDGDNDDDSELHPLGEHVAACEPVSNRRMSLGARRGLQLALSQAAGYEGSVPVRLALPTLRGDTAVQTEGKDSASGPLLHVPPVGRRRSVQIGQVQIEEEPATPLSSTTLVCRKDRRASEPSCLWSKFSSLEVMPEKLQSMPEGTPSSPKKCRKTEIGMQAALSLQ